MPMNPRLLVPRTAGYQSADADVRAYLSALRAADGGPLEIPVAAAVEAFVLGCKADSIWTAIKAACFLAGPRTLAGCLVPLVGTAPTNSNFVSADYIRKTGLAGNVSAQKQLNTNRSGTADPQDNHHVAVWVSSPEVTVAGTYIGAGNSGEATASSYIQTIGAALPAFVQYAGQTTTIVNRGSGNAVGLIGLSRSVSASYVVRGGGSNFTQSTASAAMTAQNFHVFARPNNAGTISSYSAGRIAFYSIGEALTLSLLDARLATYMAAIGAALP